MSELPPNHEHADWTAKGDDEVKFEVLPSPEVKPGWQENKRQTENGQPLRHEITDEQGRQIFVHETSYQTGPDASPETRKSDWQRFTDKYDDRDRVIRERSQKIFPEGLLNTTSLEHQYDDKTGTQTTTGRIEAGAEAGHAWQTAREVVKDFGDGRKIKRETTEVLEQGQSQNKPEKGAKFIKTMFFEGGSWIGEEVEHPDGHKTQQLAGGVEKLPTWE